MKYQIVFRQQAAVAEIHSMSCREWGWDDYLSDIVVDADHTWGAAVEAWSHEDEPEVCAVADTKFFPCLAPDYVAGPPRPRQRRPTRRNVPFDPESASDAEVIEACYGRKLVWTNGISGTDEEARLYPEGVWKKTIRGTIVETFPHRHTSITIAPDGERILNFIASGMEGTFRAVRLSAIKAVVK